MMDSQENNLMPQETEEVKKVEETVNEAAAEEVQPAAAAEEPAAEEPVAAEEPAAAEEPVAEQPAAAEEPAAEPAAAEEQPAPKRQYTTTEEVLQRITELAHGEETPAKDEVELLKTVFYKLHNAERENAQKEYLEAGGDPEVFVMPKDEFEDKFKAEMELIKEKRAKAHQVLESEKQDNLKRKLEIIERIKEMATSPEEANKNYAEFRKLQQEWRDIKAVPPERSNDLWRNYQHIVEQFYDLLKLNTAAREYDFKKNLEQKTALCEAAEHLADETDVISAFHQLQELHQQYREIGPVSKELREEVWARFKAASAVINKRHQQHFEAIRGKEEENLNLKTALCEKVEAIAKEENKGAADWERHTKEIIAVQNEWKTIGFAPQKMNQKIFDRFRAACDDFFGRKTQYFREMKARSAENAEKKRALIEQAKALQDSTDWKTTGDKLVELQKEWKTVGMVSKKLGDQLWNEFLGACNKFFEARNAATSGTRHAEKENLAKKREVIAKLKALCEEQPEDIQEQVYDLVDEYNAIGHVPFRDKDKVYREYHEVIDTLYDEYRIRANRGRQDGRSNQRSNNDRPAAPDNERSKLMKKYETLKQEIQTYENNIGFLTSTSKKGNSLIDELNKKVDKLKDDLKKVKDKIKSIDAAAAAAAEEEA